jgi:uncharacterized protein YjiS (DUF1127 family)
MSRNNPGEDPMAKIRSSDTLDRVQGHTFRATVSALLNLLALWHWRVRCRRELSTLTTRQMYDTGLNADVVWRESKKPFWEA